MEIKKKVYLGIGVIALVVILIGTSFALWNINIAQEGINKLNTDCFKIEFTDKNPISLSNAYPIEDELGMMQIPYTFTMTNVCNGSAKYQINLETMNPNGTKMLDKYLKVNLSEGNISKKTTKLDKSINNSLDTEPTIDGAIEAYKLVSGIMNPGETKEFNLRIWMDSEVTQNDPGSTNARFSGRISVISSYFEDKRGTLIATIYDEDAESTIGAFWDYKEQITKVVFEDKILPKETELSWDVSEEQNRSVMSYLVQNEEETYILYIQANDGILANEDCSNLFLNFINLKTIEGLEYFDTRNVLNMNSMFADCHQLINIDLSTFDTHRVTDLIALFANCMNLTNLDLSNFDTSNVTDMAAMFLNCLNLENLNISNFDTKNVTSMNEMFYGCIKLKAIDLKGFDTSKVTTMRGMFSNCRNLTNLDVSNFNTNNVVDMSNMFRDCENLTNLDLSHFDTNNVTDMPFMFSECINLINLDISNFDINKVTNIIDMFWNTSSNVTIYVKDETIKNWVLSKDNRHPESWTLENIVIKS